jgi:succinate dehydrogenase/fumarate reductase flavoprotein subunit
VHGANRLASNSLLEGLVFGRRIADALGRELPRRVEPADDVRPAGLLDPAVRTEVARTMSADVGVLRDDRSLREAVARNLMELRRKDSSEPCTEAWEATNLHLVASALSSAALEREETRGSHWRQDFPERDDERWLVHLVTRLSDGTITIGVEEHR